MMSERDVSRAAWQHDDDEISLWVGAHQLLRHTPSEPAFDVGRGLAQASSSRGHFTLADADVSRRALSHGWLDESTQRLYLASAPGEPAVLALTLHPRSSGVELRIQSFDDTLNRVWCRVPAEQDEHVWGGGEQFSYLDLRGRSFPLWVGEAGVGRDSSTAVTRQADAQCAGGGGDYHTTYCPQPTFLSSRHYAVHAQTSVYSYFDFSSESQHLLHFWGIPEALEFYVAEDIPTLVSVLSSRFGRPPRLPRWVMKGAILGLKDGKVHAQQRLDEALAHGVRVSALWCEDWEGLRKTTFGKRLFWDWQWSSRRYPDYEQWLTALNAAGIRFLGYVNPYLCEDGPLFTEAQRAGFLVKNPQGETYRVDFGEFSCGLVDFTLPEAAHWFETRILQREMIDKGLGGWMADFGEYQPVDAVLHEGDGWVEHNRLPVRWAKSNARAVERAGRTGDILFFMRSGYVGSQPHCPLLWGGDQSVDFSRHDGLPSVIPAALSAGLMGYPYHHSDIGGYTSLFGNVRSPELFQRWSELAAFTAVMRTHEGNRPEENVQFWHSPEVLAHFARMTRLYSLLSPYLSHLVDEAESHGWPIQRPVFFHHEHDVRTLALQDQFLYGRDVLVAPVLAEGACQRRVYLPQGVQWIHLWSGSVFDGGQFLDIEAPLGYPPVFIRIDSHWREFWESLPQRLETPL